MGVSKRLLGLLGILVAIFPVFRGELEAGEGQHIQGHQGEGRRRTDLYASNQVHPPSTEPFPFSIEKAYETYVNQKRMPMGKRCELRTMKRLNAVSFFFPPPPDLAVI